MPWHECLWSRFSWIWVLCELGSNDSWAPWCLWQFVLPSSTSNLNMMALLLARPRGAMGRALSRALHPTKPRGVPRGPGWSPLSSLCATVYPCSLCHWVPNAHLLTHSPCTLHSAASPPSSLLPHFSGPPPSRHVPMLGRTDGVRGLQESKPAASFQKTQWLTSLAWCRSWG